jgi:hypothetical protein
VLDWTLLLIIDASYNPLKTKRILLYLKTQFVPRSKHFTFQLGYKNLSVYVIWGRSRCLFWDKYKTNKYSVGRMSILKF